MRFIPDLNLSKRSLFAVSASLLLIAAFIFGSYHFLYSSTGFSGEVEPITIGFFNSEFNALIYVANDQQYFAANGLSVNVKHYNTGADAVNGLLNREVDITGASEFVIATKALENAKLYTFGSYCKSDKFYVLARTDKGIDHISDLKGKTIGYPKGTNGEFYIGRFLELNNIDPRDVTLVDMVPFIRTPMALANGTVDAAIIFQPYIDEAKTLLANNTVMWSAQAGQLAYIDAICTQEWGASNPELIKRFLNSLIQAESFILHNQEEVLDIVAKTLNYTISYLTSVWSDYQFSVTLDQAQIVAMEDEARWLITNNLTEATEVPNFNDFINIDILAELKPESVNIIR